MKALSLRQPWASLVVEGVKDIENRTWQTDYRGPLLIHAGKTPDPAFHDILRAWKEELEIDLDPADFPLGGIIGMVELVDIVTASKSEWFGGPFGWVLANPVWLEFTPYKGRLGLFDVPLTVDDLT